MNITEHRKKANGFAGKDFKEEIEMAVINNAAYAQAAYQSVYSYGKESSKKDAVNKNNVEKTAGTETKKNEEVKNDNRVEVKGAGTYGNPKLSEKALDYYNKLKEKYGNLNFVLVASDKKQEAEMLKGSFASSSALTVLIDTDKIERMATDEAYREKYEAILANAASGLTQVKEQLGSMASNVKAYGMSLNKEGGVASYFAVVDKSLAAQRERIEKKAEEKKAEKKKAEKKTEKEKAKERLENKRAENKEEEETVTISAGSMEELLRKIQDYYQQDKFNTIRTEEELAVGNQIDFSV